MVARKRLNLSRRQSRGDLPVAAPHQQEWPDGHERVPGDLRELRQLSGQSVLSGQVLFIEDDVIHQQRYLAEIEQR